MPQDVKEKAEKELRRLTQMSQYNPEASMYAPTWIGWSRCRGLPKIQIK